MAIKTYGKLYYDKAKNNLVIEEAQPHVCIKLKQLFIKMPKYAIAPFIFDNTDENCTDLLWFSQRYPLKMDANTEKVLKDGKKYYERKLNHVQSLLMPKYKPQPIKLKNGFEARKYQLQAKDIYLNVQRLLLCDDLGLGKTLSSILSLNPHTLPVAIVVQTHMPTQWKVDGIEKFTNLSAHVIKSTTPYNLPVSDVYIFKYSQLSKWSNIFETKFFNSAIFDEIQELRRSVSDKYFGAKNLSNNVSYCIGLSATPIYNYGDEMFNVLDLIKPGSLGEKEDFLREWATPIGNDKWKIKDPNSFGTYLRDNCLMLRRTKADVGMELPQVNTIIHTVGYDHEEVKKSEDLAKQLAMRVVTGSFLESGKAALELDKMVRHLTGVSKARGVAAYVKMLLETGQKVLLAGWHRDVYDIWLEELKEYNPVMYTGSESGTQKERAKQSFINGESELMIISLRSGAGLDGLQHVCDTVVIGELDWSPKVHEQLIGRINRPGQKNAVMAIYITVETGSDPVIIDLLGLKNSQSTGIIDPTLQIPEQYSDESRIKKLANAYLSKHEKTD